MAYWVWDATFSVGIEVIDEQHKRIIEYINELNTASTYHDKQKVYTILSSLVEYTVSHFAFEECLLEASHYTTLESHKQVHNAFIRRIEFFKERYESGEDITKQLMAELQIWLIHHIQHEDKSYSESVKRMLEFKTMKTAQKSEEQNWVMGMIGKFFKI